MDKKLSPLKQYTKMIGITLVILKFFNLIDWGWLKVILPFIVLLTIPAVTFILSAIIYGIRKGRKS
ncbi:hypothetical protein LJC68_06075 [Bacteroidales bacterium OttesenSCG-928-B11]|nr:hypothetical protein [Bacteroidales bacterium OttesenSCG-928-B11]